MMGAGQPCPLLYMTNVIEKNSFWELLLWIGRQRRRFRVTGLSMLPLLQPGDEILVDVNAYHRQLPQPGHIVVAQHPYNPKIRIVKRVAAVQADGSCFLTGDNQAESTDSRMFGWMSSQQILGKVTSRFLVLTSPLPPISTTQGSQD